MSKIVPKLVSIRREGINIGLLRVNSSAIASNGSTSESSHNLERQGQWCGTFGRAVADTRGPGSNPVIGNVYCLLFVENTKKEKKLRGPLVETKSFICPWSEVAEPESVFTLSIAKLICGNALWGFCEK